MMYRTNMFLVLNLFSYFDSFYFFSYFISLAIFFHFFNNREMFVAMFVCWT